ncbi:MAG: UPF0175 family protein [Oscillospiraceae bacterium]|jgi:hypothetical protein|nr:UPF0175 family protein [Oscillospiraceae bacterium]
MQATFDMPEAVSRFVDVQDNGYQLRLKEMMMFDLVRRGLLSFGKAAELLGIGKVKLITDLGQLGLPYFDMPASEVFEDAAVARRFSEGGA